MSKLKETMTSIFNWKKNPASVFSVAAPLAVLGMGLTLLQAILQYVIRDDPGFLLIWVAIVGPSAYFLYRMVRQHKRFQEQLSKVS